MSPLFYGRDQFKRSDGKNRVALPAARIYFPVFGNLRRTQRVVGLRPARCRAQAQHQGGVVARHGHRAQRARATGRRAEAVPDDRHRVVDHHAPARVEDIRPLRPVQRHDGRLPREQTPLPPRPYQGCLGGARRPKGVRHLCHRRRRQGGDHSPRAAVFQAEGQVRRQTCLARRRHRLDDDQRDRPGARP